MNLYQRAKRFLWMLAIVAVAQAAITVQNRTANWPPQSGTSFAFGGPFDIFYQAVPTTLTALDTKDCHIIEVTVYNSTGSPITFTMQTGDASPLAMPLTGSVAANTSVSFNIPGGLLVKSGFSVQASGSGLNFHATWTH
jgi:hypothetical protein